MASINGRLRGARTQGPPICSELEAIFRELPDEELLTKLTGPRRRGPKGYDPSVLWHCYVAYYVLDLDSVSSLIRLLYDNPFIAQACGIDSPDDIPSQPTFSRFFAKLTKRQYLFRVRDVSRSMVRRCYTELQGFGERVALDSTTQKAWSNGGKPTPSDPQAGWSVKKNTHGKTEYTLGYKLHLLVDCEYELPIAANVSPGNVHDAKKASNVLSEARFTTKKFHPSFVMADAGYSGQSLLHLIRRQYAAQPIIQTNPPHRKRLPLEYRAEQTTEWKAL